MAFRKIARTKAFLKALAVITQIQCLEKPPQLKDYRTKEPVLVYPGEPERAPEAHPPS